MGVITVIQALKDARKTVDEIFSMTQALTLSGEKESEEQEVAAYFDLIEARQPLVERLNHLKKEIDATATASEEFKEIKKVITDIAALDKRHLAFMQQISESVQGSIKEVKINQKLHAAYGNAFETSRLFDIRK